LRLGCLEKNIMIEFVKIKKSFKNQCVLDGIDLQIEDSKITVIIGESGGGKSVLLKHIIGLLKPDSGQIYIDGIETTGMKEKNFMDVKNFYRKTL